MRKETKICDHCGKEIEEKIPEGNGSGKILKKFPKSEYGNSFNCKEIGTSFDLCDDCQEAFVDERNRFATYRRAFENWTKTYVNYKDDCDCEKSEAPSYYEDNDRPMITGTVPQENNTVFGRALR
jgi:hypothetical protein